MGPLLLVNPRAGDDRPTTQELRGEAERRIHVHVLGPGQDPAVAAGGHEADAIAIAGGDGSLAAVALDRDVPFVCLPFGTRNHVARDLGLDRDDPLRALDAFASRERRIDVGRVNGRPFLNNVSLGAYARLVHRRERHRRRGEALAALRTLELALLRHRPMDAVVDERPVRARVLLVASNHYRLDLLSIGERERLDEGLLHMDAAPGLLPWTCEERTAPSFTIDLGAETVPAAADAEPLELESPIHVTIEHRALRVFVPDTTIGGAMHDQPQPTEEEHEQVPERQTEEEAMRQAGHEDPDRVRVDPDEEKDA